MEDLLILFALLAVGFAIIGCIATLRWLWRAFTTNEEAAAAPVERVVRVAAPLDRAAKLAIAEELLGDRLPADLRAELAATRAPATIAPVEVAPAPPAPALAELSATAPPAAAVTPGLLTFENVVFLLAACLILGGTSYVVATTWGRVPDRWQFAYAEGVVIFYGVLLAAAIPLVERRAQAPQAARVLAAITLAMAVAAALIAGATPATLAAGAVLAAGGAVAMALALVAARALLALEGVAGRGAWLAAIATGLVAAAAARAGGAAAALAVALGAGFARIPRAPSASFVLAALAPLGAALALPVAVGLAPSTIAPAVVASLFALRAATAHLPRAMLGLVALVVSGFALWLAAPEPGALVATAALALLAATPAYAHPDVPRAIAAVGVGGPLALVAFTWPAGFGFAPPPWAMVAALPAALLGAGAIPFSLALFALVRARVGDEVSGLRRWPVAGLTALGFFLLAGAAALALAPHPDLVAASALVAVAAALVAHGFARKGASAEHAVAADALAVAAAFALGHVVGARFSASSTAALIAAGIAGLLLVAGPRRPGYWLGLAVVPGVVLAALGAGSPRLLAPGLLAVYGALLFLQRRSSAALALPSLCLALDLALFGTLAGDWPHPPTAAWWPFVWRGLVLAAALAPPAAWLAARPAPAYLVIEVALGLVLAALLGDQGAALVVALVFVLARTPSAREAAPWLVSLLALVTVARGAPPWLVAPALAAGAGLFLARARHQDAEAPGAWLVLPLGLGAVLVAIFFRPGGVPVLPLRWLPTVVAAALLAAVPLLARTRAALAARSEGLVLAIASAAFAIAIAHVERPGSVIALGAGAGALAALAAGLLAARGPLAGAARAAWLLFLYGVPLAVTPMTGWLLRWPGAVAGVAAVAVVLAVSRARQDARLGGVALATGLFTVGWAAAAAAKPFSRGGDPARHLPLIAIAVALYALGAARLGPRLAAVTPRFCRRLAEASLVGAAGLVALAALLHPPEGPADVAKVMAALVTLALAAVATALHFQRARLFYLAEAAPPAAYLYLRTLTPWLDPIADWDAVVAVALAFLYLAVERSLHALARGFGARETRHAALALPLATLALVELDRVASALPLLLAAGFYAGWAQREAGRAGAALAAVAGIFANLGVVPLWLAQGWRSPLFVALPVAATLGLWERLYQRELGTAAPVLRTLAAIILLGAGSIEMFRFDSPLPALVLAASSIAAIALGLAFRVRAYLSFGFASLLFDIVANLTRFGARDRLTGGLIGLGAGLVLLVLGIEVSRHKQTLRARYQELREWEW